MEVLFLKCVGIVCNLRMRVAAIPARASRSKVSFNWHIKELAVKYVEFLHADRGGL